MISSEQSNPATGNSLPTQKKGKAGIVIAVILGVLILTGVIGWLNRPFLYQEYFLLFGNKLKNGDKLYISALNYQGEKGKGFDLNLYRKIRPLTADDIDEMNIDLARKVLLKQNINSSNKPYITECNWLINADSLHKYQTKFIGNYLGGEVIDAKAGNKYFPLIFFAISPNKKAMIRDDESIYKLPDGYTWEEGPFYVIKYSVDNQISKN